MRYSFLFLVKYLASLPLLTSWFWFVQLFFEFFGFLFVFSPKKELTESWCEQQANDHEQTYTYTNHKIETPSSKLIKCKQSHRMQNNERERERDDENEKKKLSTFYTDVIMKRPCWIFLVCPSPKRFLFSVFLIDFSLNSVLIFIARYCQVFTVRFHTIDVSLTRQILLFFLSLCVTILRLKRYSFDRTKIYRKKNFIIECKNASFYFLRW